MQGNSVIKQFPVIIKPDKGLSKMGQAKYDFMKAQVDRVNNGIKGKDNYKYKTRDQQ